MKSTADKLKSEDIKLKLSIENLQRLDRLKSAVEAARQNASKPLSVRLRDQVSKELNKIRSEINSLTSKAHSVIVNVKTNGAEKLSKIKGGISEGIGGAAMGMGATMLGTAGIGYGVVNAVQSQMNYEAQMSSVKAILSGSYSGEELNKTMLALDARAEELAATTKFTAKEVAQAFYYQGMAGWSKEQMTAGIKPILDLAAAGNTDLATTSDIVTDSLTAFGLKAGENVKVNGQVVESSKHYTDMMAALVTNANTDITQLGEALKYAAPLVQSMYANGTAADRMYGAQDLMLVSGLMANAGIKGSQAGTSARAMFTRLSSQNRNAYFGQNALGVDFLDESGEVRRLQDIVTDFRKVFKEGADMGKVTDFFEQISGEKIHKDTRRKLESYFENAQKNGGKLSGSDMMKMTAMMAGQEAMSGWLATFLASDEDFKKIQASLENCEGAAGRMAEIQMDNLAGSITLLGSAWDAFQRAFVKGDAGDGLRSFVDSVTDSLLKTNKLFADGVDFSDLVSLGADAVNKLKNKFLELDGIGSLLAGGALFFGLKKVISLAMSAKNTVADLFKARSVSDLSGKITNPAQSLQSVGTMNVRAGVVNISGPVKGGFSKNQAAVDAYYQKKNQILNSGTTSGRAIPPTSTGRFATARANFGGAGAMAALFGAMDVLATRTNSNYTNAQAADELAKAKQELQFLKENNADIEQINAQLSKIRAAEENVKNIAAQNEAAERVAGAGAAGMLAGALAGSFLGPFGSMIGGFLGQYIGEYFADNYKPFNQKSTGKQIEESVKNTGGTVGKSIAEFGGVKSVVEKVNQSAREYRQTDEGKEQTRREVVQSRRRRDYTGEQIKIERETAAAQRQSQLREQRIQENQERVKNFGYTSLAQDYTQNAPKIEVPKIQTPKFEFPKIETPQVENQSTVQSLTTANAAAGLSAYSMNIPKVEMPEINIAEKLESAKSSISSFGEEISNSLSGSFESLQSNFSTFCESFSSIFETVKAGFSSFGEEISTSLSTSFESLQSNFSTFGESFSGSFEMIRANFSTFGEELVTSFSSSFESLSASASSTFAGLSATIQGGVESARATITVAFSSAAAEVQGIWSGIQGFFSGLFGGLGGIAAGAGAAIAAGINSGIGMIMGAWEALSGWLSSKIASLSSMAAGAASMIGIGSNAKGTSSWRGGFTTVNEHGGEIINLPSGQTIYPFQTVAEIAHNYNGTSFFDGGGWSEFKGGSELMFLPRGTQIIPHAPTVRILRQQIKEKLKNGDTYALNQQSAMSKNSLASNVGYNYWTGAARKQNIQSNFAFNTGNTQRFVSYSGSSIQNQVKEKLNDRKTSTTLLTKNGNSTSNDATTFTEINGGKTLSDNRTYAANKNRSAGSSQFGGRFNFNRERLSNVYRSSNTVNLDEGRLYRDNVQGFTIFSESGPLSNRTGQSSHSTGQYNFLRAENSRNSAATETYDELGNLKNIYIPEYNRITAEDSLTVKKAKQAAQARSVSNDTGNFREIIQGRNDAERLHRIFSATARGFSQVELSAENKKRIGIKGGVFAGVSSLPLGERQPIFTGAHTGLLERFDRAENFNTIGNLNNDLPVLDFSPNLPAVSNSSSTTNNSNSSSNSSSNVSFNFGGVNISNGMDFDNFTHRLTQLFTQGAANSVSW